MKKLFPLLLLFGVMGTATAQTTTGIGTLSPNPGAQLDVTSTSLTPGASTGFLAPRVPLSSATTWTLAGTATDGMMVFNTATVSGANAITPGYYYWYNSQWLAFSQSTSPTIAGSATISCASNTVNISPASSTLANGQAYSGSVTFPYTNGNGGTLPANVVTQSGLTVSHGAGTLSNGSGQIVYSVSGTYTGTTGTTMSMTLTLPGTTCTVTLPQAVATFASGSLNCNTSTAAAGTYQAGIAMTSSNTKSISITPTAAGSYSFSTDVKNGVSFAATGTFTAAQANANQTVNLVASGTPTASGSFTYTVSAGGQTCTFAVSFAPAATFACGNATQAQNPAGSLVNGTVYTGSYTIPYTAGNGGTYPNASQTITGLTLSRAAGTYAAGSGNVVYTLSGTYTGTAATVTFPIAECTSVTYGDALRGALTKAGGASTAAYDAAAADTWVPVTAAEYDAVASTSNVAGAVKSGASDAIISNPSNYGWTGPNTVGPQQNNASFWGNPVTNNYLIAYKAVMNSTFNGLQIKTGTTVKTGFAAYGSTTNGSGGTNYYVLKRPSITAGSNAYIGIFVPSSSAMGVGTSNGPVNYGSGDVSNLSNNSSGEPCFQAVSTPTKQW